MSGYQIGLVNVIRGSTVRFCPIINVGFNQPSQAIRERKAWSVGAAFAFVIWTKVEMLIKPFAALRPAPEKGGRRSRRSLRCGRHRRSARPGRRQPRQLPARVPPEIDLPDSVDIHAMRSTRRARAPARLPGARTLLREADERLYVYRQVMGAQQTGSWPVAISRIPRRYHPQAEKTRRTKRTIRTRHCLELNANTGPVFLTYRDQAAVDALVAQFRPGRASTSPPLTHPPHRVARRGRRRAVGRILPPGCPLPMWRRPPPRRRRVPSWQASAREQSAHTGKEEYNWFLAVLFPARNSAFLRTTVASLT
jgi:hypothetical protein